MEKIEDIKGKIIMVYARFKCIGKCEVIAEVKHSIKIKILDTNKYMYLPKEMVLAPLSNKENKNPSVHIPSFCKIKMYER